MMFKLHEWSNVFFCAVILFFITFRDFRNMISPLDFIRFVFKKIIHSNSISAFGGSWGICIFLMPYLLKHALCIIQALTMLSLCNQASYVLHLLSFVHVGLVRDEEIRKICSSSFDGGSTSVFLKLTYIYRYVVKTETWEDF